MLSSGRRGLLVAGGFTLANSVFAVSPVPVATVKTLVRDDLDRSVSLALPLKRVVVFNRYTTEFIRAIGAMPSVVGVDIDSAKHRAYWPTVSAAMFAGSGQNSPNFEAIVAMQPDAVFMPRNSDWKKAERLLADFGIPVVVFTAWDLLKHEQNMDLLGRLFNQPARAKSLNVFYRGWRDSLAFKLRDAVRPRIYFEEVSDYKTVLRGSGWHDMVDASGGLNIFGDVQLVDAGVSGSARGSVQAFTVDPEEVIARRPDVIIKLQPGQYEPHAVAFSSAVLKAIAARPGFAQLPAVRTGQVYHLSYYLAGGCSKITGAVQIAKWLHPKRLADVDPDAVMGRWLREFQGVAPQTGYWRSLAQLRS